MNSDSIHKEYMLILESHPEVKTIENLNTNSLIFSQSWEPMQHSSPVNHDYSLTNVGLEPLKS